MHSHLSGCCETKNSLNLKRKKENGELIKSCVADVGFNVELEFKSKFEKTSSFLNNEERKRAASIVHELFTNSKQERREEE